MKKVRPYRLWLDQRVKNTAWVERVNAAMTADERDRPREAEEARLLRERGIPPARVGTPR